MKSQRGSVTKGTFKAVLKLGLNRTLDGAVRDNNNGTIAFGRSMLLGEFLQKLKDVKSWLYSV